MNALSIIILVVIIFILFIIVSCVKVVPQAHVFVVERLGSFYAQWETGLHMISIR